MSVSPEDLKSLLESRGWQAKIDESPKDIVKIKSKHIMKCVDGRGSDQPDMQGPKTLGGVYAIASVRGVRTKAGLKKIVKEVQAKGYGASVHGDTCGTMGCGYFKLWKTGQLPALTPPKYDGDDGRIAVLEEKGTYEWLVGGHEETHTIINFRKGWTFEPKPKAQRFVLDAWVADEFKLDLVRYLTLAAETVERLRPAAMVAHIVPAK
ncbi:MAG: hypothetical protein JJ863_30480 [Deltaproteobacteria bacterium]|nr:hypothetical protein [Deltaproteobacteria bacterium]